MSKKPTVLMILDGYGLNPETKGNAVAEAKTPVMDQLMSTYPFVQGQASGMAVGLPDGQMGNSEVGHLNMGAGRIVYQDLTKITKSIQDGDFFENEALLAACKNVKENNSDLHLFGLVSDGGVHSHNTHIYGLLELAKKQGIERVYVHCFLDGRDTPPSSGKGYVEELVTKMKEIGVGRVASVMGRYYAMDRDNRWDRVELAYKAIVRGEGNASEDPVAAIQVSYVEGKTDEFVLPTVITKDGKALATVKENDSVIFFNFRPDRAREITRAFCDDHFDGFDRGERIKTTFVCFTDYDVTIQNKLVAFYKTEIKNTFGEFLANNNMTQARIAETEKYAHVTFFFNGGVEEPNKGEDRILVKSPKVATYDLQPEMSAYEVDDKLVEAIKSNKYDVIIINFANPDMVGHTGVESAAIAAIEAVDKCVGKAVDAIKAVDGQMFICADHGNAEQLIDPVTGAPFTAHTTNPVPFILVNADPSYELREGGCLADIAPTLIELMGMKQPEEMTGKSLLKRNNDLGEDGDSSSCSSKDDSSSDIKAILYTSNTGYTKEYAEMLSDKLSIPAYNTSDDLDQVPAGTEIIYMGWIKAGGVKGYEKIAKSYQVRALCGVGLSVDTGKQVDEIAERHHVSESTEVFYLQGGFDMGRLSGVNKLLMKVMRDVVRRSIAKKDDVTEDEQIAYNLMCKGGSFVNESNLVQIEEWYKAQL